jgi:GNAT superfamily N-acetyltransferase
MRVEPLGGHERAAAALVVERDAGTVGRDRDGVAAALRDAAGAGARGFVALDGHEIVGFLSAHVVEDPPLPAYAFSGAAEHAAAPGAARDAYALLYRAASPAWAAAGAALHRVLLPARDEAGLAAWARLGFGWEKFHAVCDLAAPPAPSGPPAGVEIRRATSADEALVRSLADVVPDHTAGPPAWAPVPDSYLEEIRDGYAELAREGGGTCWLALRDGRAVGLVLMLEASGDPLLVPPWSIGLAVGATVAAERGRGAGRALAERALAEAAAAGHRWCVADWRSANLEADAFWPARGFRRVAIRVARRLEPLAMERAAGGGG